MPTTFARRQGWLKEPQVDEQAEELLPLDDRWKRWRDREEIRRLGFGAVVSCLSPLESIFCRDVDADGVHHPTQVFDCTGTALWNMDSSSLYLDAAHTALPCHDTLWVSSSVALNPSSLKLLLTACFLRPLRTRLPPKRGLRSSARRSCRRNRRPCRTSFEWRARTPHSARPPPAN